LRALTSLRFSLVLVSCYHCHRALPSFLHDALPIFAIRMIHACGLVEAAGHFVFSPGFVSAARAALKAGAMILCDAQMVAHGVTRDRKSTRLNSSHVKISYAVFCLKKKKAEVH